MLVEEQKNNLTLFLYSPPQPIKLISVTGNIILLANTLETAVFLIAVFISVFLSIPSSKTLQKSFQKVCLVIGIIF